MTEKQWKIISEEFISYSGGNAQIISNGECKISLWERPEEAQLFCDKLNDLHEENIELKELLHTILTQIDVENINTSNEVFSARIMFTQNEFKMIKEIWNENSMGYY